jgi:type IV pilus assembly protein PilV
MYRMKSRKFIMKKSQSGITLLESLVAIVVTALGILGILGVQMRTLTDTSTTTRRAQAVRLIEDLSERMKANPNALVELNNYVSNFADTPTAPNCTAGCDNAQLVKYQLAAWKKSVSDQLPVGKASVFIPPAENGVAAGQRRQLGIMIAWRENERDSASTYKDSIDATKILNGSGTLVAGGGTDKATNACPDNSTCHLQYIPVPARCAPYAPGGGTPIYYCPGA